MITRQMVGWGLVLVLVGVPEVLLAELKGAPVASIELEKEVHFLTPEEANVVIPPGYYTVKAEENGLQLIGGLIPHEAGAVFLIQAKQGNHEEHLDGPLARTISLNEGVHYLALLLPGGQSLESIGSYSEVRSRGGDPFQSHRDLLAEEIKKARERESHSFKPAFDIIQKEIKKAREREARSEERLRLEQEESRREHESVILELKREANEAKKRTEQINNRWRAECSNRYPHNVNDHNNCCVKKRSKCLRLTKNKVRSVKQICEDFNKACWIIRKKANPTWMNTYCQSSKNRKKLRVNSRKRCCSKMYSRCAKTSQSVPAGDARKTSLIRCQQAQKICKAS